MPGEKNLKNSRKTLGKKHRINTNFHRLNDIMDANVLGDIRDNLCFSVVHGLTRINTDFHRLNDIMDANVLGDIRDNLCKSVANDVRY